MSADLASVLSAIPFSWDVVLFLGLLLLGLGYGFSVGRDRAVTMLLSTYLALAVVTNTPILARLSVSLNTNRSSEFQLAWFLGTFFVIFAILWRSHLLRNLAHDRGTWWETALFSVVQVGLLTSIALFLLPFETTQKLSPLFQEAFLGEIGRSFWLLAPIPLLYVIGRDAFSHDFIDEE